MILKNSKLLIILLILLICGGIFFFNDFRKPADPVFQEQDFLIKQARHPLVVHGFQFSGYHQGEKNITIKAVRHSIEKMKLGLFRSGCLRIAKFKGAEIDIYAKQVESEKNSEGDSQKSDYSLKGTFTQEQCRSSHLKTVVSYLFEPVKINFYNGKSLITQIQANRASLESKDRRIVFQGNVLATSECRSLTTDKLTLFPR